MSTIDIIPLIGSGATILFSVIALLQARKSEITAKGANELAEGANKLAEDANKAADEANITAKEANTLSDTANKLSLKAFDNDIKGYMPMVRFTGRMNSVKKSIFVLRNQVTFDFNKVFVNLSNIDENKAIDNGEYSEVVCIEAEIENCGSGAITGIGIKYFVIQTGNKVTMENDYDGDEDVSALCYIEKSTDSEDDCVCSEDFILPFGETMIVNFVITKNVMELADSDDFQWAQDCIMEYLEEHEDNIMILMSLDIKSVNNSIYEQVFLNGTYVRKELVHNSFGGITLKPKQPK